MDFASDGRKIGHSVSFTPHPSSQRMGKVQAQVDEVVEIMKVNVEKVMERDANLSRLDDRADALQESAQRFKTAATSLRRKYWWQNVRLFAFFVFVIAALLLFAIVMLLKS